MDSDDELIEYDIADVVSAQFVKKVVVELEKMHRQKMVASIMTA